MNIRKWFVLQILYFKRLFLKKSFVVLLCLVPLMVLGLRIISSEDNGIVKILLCMEDDRDELASQTVDYLLESDSVFAYEYCEDADEALKKLERGEADAVWLFPDDMLEVIRKSCWQA